MTKPPPKPRMFDLSSAQATPDEADWGEELPPEEAPAVQVAAPRARGFRALTWAFSALASLGVMYISLQIYLLIGQLLEQHLWLGRAAMGLAAIAVLSLVFFALREVLAVRRLARIDRLREGARAAHATGNLRDARKVVADLETLYRGRADVAWGRANLAEHRADIVDADALLELAEVSYLAGLDEQAGAAARAAAARVAAVTAISPLVVLDTVVVFYNNARLVREIADIYGGRPGWFASMRLVRHVFVNILMAGGLSIGDDFIGQVLGHGLTAKLSARLGEGIVNGFLTARIGIVAMELCRPMPFQARTRPSVRQIAADALSQMKVG